MYKCAQIASGQCALIEGDNDGCHLCVTLALCSSVMATSCQETVEDKFLIFEEEFQGTNEMVIVDNSDHLVQEFIYM